MLRTLLSPLLVLLIAGTTGCRKAPNASTTSTAVAAQAPVAAGQPPAVPKPLPAQLPNVLARVNGRDVKKSEFDMLLRNIEVGQGPIPAERRDEILRSALDQLITYTLLSQEAESRHLTASDAEVDERVKGMRQNFPNEEMFKKALAARNMSLERLRSDTRVDIQIAKLMDSEVATAAAVTDAEVREFYDKNPDRFKQPETVRASHILIKVDEKADAATKKQARARIEGLRKRAKGGEDFGKLARENSQDGSAPQGGDLGYFGHGQMVPQFDQAAFALKPGQVSDIVTTQFGYHIIKVTDRKPAGTLPLAQVNDRLKQLLMQQKKQQRADAFITALKQKSKIEVLV